MSKGFRGINSNFIFNDPIRIKTERKESEMYLWAVEDVFRKQTGDVFYIFKDANYKHLGRVSMTAWFEGDA